MCGVLSKHKFPATVIFLTVAGEEQGLNGSTHFAKMAKEQGWQLEGVLNNDIVGGNRTPGDTCTTITGYASFLKAFLPPRSEADIKRIRNLGGESDSGLARIGPLRPFRGETYDFGAFSPKLIFRRDRYLRGGDHSAFNEQGFAAVRFTEYREDFNHQHRTCARKMASNMETC